MCTDDVNKRKPKLNLFPFKTNELSLSLITPLFEFSKFYDLLEMFALETRKTLINLYLN